MHLHALLIVLTLIFLNSLAEESSQSYLNKNKLSIEEVFSSTKVDPFNQLKQNGLIDTTTPSPEDNSSASSEEYSSNSSEDSDEFFESREETVVKFGY